MNERVEAAAKAAHVSKLTGVQWDGMPKWKRMDRINEARAALAAADAVMFSQQAVERAAKAAYESTMEDGDTPWEHFGGSSYLDYYRAHARAVIAALKGAGDE